MADQNFFSRAIGAITGGGAPEAIEKAAVPTGTLGSTAADAYEMNGVVVEEADRHLSIVGNARFAEYDRLVRDVSIVGASVRLFLNLIANAVWTVNPPEGLNGNEEPVAQGYADTMYDILFGMTSSWSSVVKKTAAYRLQGFSIMEWTAVRRDDGVIGLLDIEHRPQRSIARWLRDANGTVEGVVQRINGREEVTLPRSKIVYAVDDTLTDSPEGVGLYRHLVESAQRLRMFLQLEEVGFTTDLRGIPIARAPLGELAATVTKAKEQGDPAHKVAQAKRAMMLQPLRNFLDKHIRNAKTGMMLPSDTFASESADKTRTPSQVPKWGIELLNGDSTSFDAMANAIKRLNEEIARILGTEHLLLGSDGVGSLALARSKVGTFYLTVTATLLDLVEIYDRDIIAPIATLNGWPEELWPQMSVNEISDRDIEQVLTALKDLATAGAPVMPNDPAVGEVYDLLGLTRPPERDDEMDLSLNPGRNQPRDPADPDAPMDRTREEQRIAKALRSRRNMAKRRKRR